MFHYKFSLLLGSEMSHDGTGLAPVVLRVPAGSRKRIMEKFSLSRSVL
jgi:hypothetical protein